MGHILLACSQSSPVLQSGPRQPWPVSFRQPALHMKQCQLVVHLCQQATALCWQATGASGGRHCGCYPEACKSCSALIVRSGGERPTPPGQPQIVVSWYLMASRQCLPACALQAVLQVYLHTWRAKTSISMPGCWGSWSSSRGSTTR